MTDKKIDKKTAEERIDLDYEVTSQKPLWLMVKLPTGESYRIRVSTMIEAVYAKYVEGQISFDVDAQWRTRWEKID